MSRKPPPIVNAVDQVALATKAERDQKRKERDEGDLRFVMSKPEGRRLLWRLMSEFGLHDSSFTLNASETAFNEGRRLAALNLYHELQAVTPEQYLQALRESQRDQL